MNALFGLPVFRDPLDPAVLYVFHQQPELDWRRSQDWLPLYDPELTAFKVRFGYQDIAAMPFVTAFGLDGVSRPDAASRAAIDWRVNWYRDPGAAWWEA